MKALSAVVVSLRNARASLQNTIGPILVPKLWCIALAGFLKESMWYIYRSGDGGETRLYCSEESGRRQRTNLIAMMCPLRRLVPTRGGVLQLRSAAGNCERRRDVLRSPEGSIDDYERDRYLQIPPQSCLHQSSCQPIDVQDEFGMRCKPRRR